MKHAVPKKGAHAARPIKTKRDHSGATAAAKRLAAQAAHDAEAEKRLQSLLHELDRFEDLGEDALDLNPRIGTTYMRRGKRLVVLDNLT